MIDRLIADAATLQRHPRLSALFAVPLSVVALAVFAQEVPIAQPLAPRNVSPSATKPGVTVSATKQFVIHGADLNTRGAFSMISEETSKSLGALLRDDARYVIPVVVVLKTPPDVNAAESTVTPLMHQLVPSGFHLQINVQLRPDFRTEDYTRELIRVLLGERILRNHEQLKTNRQRVLPDWTLTGIMQALDFRSRTRPSAVFSAVFRSGQIYSVDRILAADPTGLDALSRTIFDTSSCALVLTLLDQPEGALRFSHFLGSLATGEQSDRELLEHYFPGLGASKNSMEKWWTLQLASLATPTALETMSVEDTEAALDQALTLHFKKDTEKEKEKTKETNKEEATKPKDEPKKDSGGLFNWFGGSKKEALPDGTKKPDEKAKSQPKTDKPKVKEMSKDDKPAGDPKKESGGFFHWFGGGKKEAPADEKKTDDKAKSQSKTDPPKEKEKAKEPESKKDEAVSDEDEKKPFFRLPEMANPLGRKIFFPFSKKKTDESEESDSAKEEAEKKDAKKKPGTTKASDKPATKEPDKKEKDKPSEKKSSEKKPAEPAKKSREVAAKPESPITEQNKIAPKKDSKRAISGRPADLPANEPPASIKKPEAKKEDKASEEHRSSLNPLNWFRKGAPQATTGSIVLKKIKSDAEKQTEAPKKIPREGLPIEDFKQIWKREDRAEIFQNNLQQLNALKLRAHPLYRNLITDYANILDQLSHGKDRGVVDKLDKLRQQRVKIHEGAAAVESYVDWYEASQVQTFSGVFDDYLKLRKKLDEEVRPRSDALSKYLDAVQKEFE